MRVRFVRTKSLGTLGGVAPGEGCFTSRGVWNSWSFVSLSLFHDPGLEAAAFALRAAGQCQPNEVIRSSVFKVFEKHQLDSDTFGCKDLDAVLRCLIDLDGDYDVMLRGVDLVGNFGTEALEKCLLHGGIGAVAAQDPSDFVLRKWLYPCAIREDLTHHQGTRSVSLELDYVQVAKDIHRQQIHAPAVSSRDLPTDDEQRS